MLNDVVLSVENIIDYQDESFFRELSQIFRLWEQNEYSDIVLGEKFDEAVFKRLGLKVKFQIDPNPQPNAWAMPVQLDSNHALGNRLGEELQELLVREMNKMSASTMRRIAKGEIDNTGMMDYKRARVSGMFSQVKVDCAITHGLLYSASPEECAAIMLHELGHVWTFFSFLGINNFRNAVILNACQEYLNVKTEEEKYKVVIKQVNTWGVNVDPKKFSELDDKDATLVLAGSIHRKFTYDVGYLNYNINTSEVIADQFAIRMGAGKYLGQALDKMMGNRTFFQNVVYSVSFVLSMALMLGGAIMSLAASPLAAIGWLLVGVVTFFSTTSGQSEESSGWTYDNDKDRFQRMLNEVVKRLKDRRLPPNIVKNILHEVDAMEKIVAKHSQYWTLPMWIWNMISSKARNQEERKLYQQTVEKLIANKLYVQAAKLKQLGM